MPEGTNRQGPSTHTFCPWVQDLHLSPALGCWSVSQLRWIVVLIFSPLSCCPWLGESPGVLGLPGWSLELIHPWLCLGLSTDLFPAHGFVCPAEPLQNCAVVGEDTALPWSHSAPSLFPPALAAPWKKKYILMFFSRSFFSLSTVRSLQQEMVEATLF